MLPALHQLPSGPPPAQSLTPAVCKQASGQHDSLQGRSSTAGSSNTHIATLIRQGRVPGGLNRSWPTPTDVLCAWCSCPKTKQRNTATEGLHLLACHSHTAVVPQTAVNYKMPDAASPMSLADHTVLVLGKEGHALPRCAHKQTTLSCNTSRCRSMCQ